MNKTFNLVIVLAIIAGFGCLSVPVFAQSENNVNANFIGKWTLAKVEVIKIQHDKAIDTVTYTPSNFPGTVHFEKVECFPDGRAVYSGKCNKGLNAGGSIQFYGNDSELITFHGRTMGVGFIFKWRNDPDGFTLIEEILHDQLSAEKERVQLHYTKQ